MNKNGTPSYNLKRKRLKTYKIKSVQWNNKLTNPLDKFYAHNITLPMDKFYVHEPMNQEPRVPLKPMKQRTHEPTRNINSSEEESLYLILQLTRD